MGASKRDAAVCIAYFMISSVLLWAFSDLLTNKLRAKKLVASVSLLNIHYHPYPAGVREKSYISATECPMPVIMQYNRNLKHCSTEFH